MTDPVEDWPMGRLLSTASRLVEHAWIEALDERGLTHAGLIALHLLGEAPLSQTELARLARVETQTMSRTIDRLERAGFIERTPDERDRRRMIVTRTPSGEEAWQATQALERDVFPDVDDPAALRAGLLAIIRSSSRQRWE